MSHRAQQEQEQRVLQEVHLQQNQGTAKQHDVAIFVQLRHRLTQRREQEGIVSEFHSSKHSTYITFQFSDLSTAGTMIPLCVIVIPLRSAHVFL